MGHRVFNPLGFLLVLAVLYAGTEQRTAEAAADGASSAATAIGGAGTWCVASPSASDLQLQAALDIACATGADCSAILPGGSCYYPDTLYNHASYAINSYYHNTLRCNFGGVATITNTDPSSGSCQYPSSG